MVYELIDYSIMEEIPHKMENRNIVIGVLADEE